MSDDAKRWEVGKVYLTRGRRSRIQILANDLRGPEPIAGLHLEPKREGDDLQRWNAAGKFNPIRGDTMLDLTTELAP